MKGSNLIGLVKLLRGLRKTRPLQGLSPAALALLDERVLVTDWYPFEPFLEFVELTYRDLLKGSEEAALQMGIAGGREALAGVHKAFISQGDAAASLLAMKPAWRAYFDFAQLSAEKVGTNAVRFNLIDYPDVGAAHGMLIVGWHVAAARLAGSEKARAEVVLKPWTGAPHLAHCVHF